jgi:hypothetical protein
MDGEHMLHAGRGEIGIGEDASLVGEAEEFG